MAGNEPVRVWANGCFDVFHFGHANFLRQAKEMGGYLIAGVHGDLDIAKNKAIPVIDESERAKIISSVKWVDEIQTGIPYGNVLETLNTHACEFCVHGDDIAQDASGCDIYSECKKNGMFRECKRTEGISTTMIIDRILLGNAGGRAIDSASPHVNGTSSDETKHVRESSENDEESKVPQQNSNGASQLFVEMPEEYYQEKMKEFSANTSSTSEDKKIVYTQGVFDLFHSGHVDFLSKCKTDMNDEYLVVGILNDEEILRVYGSYPVTNTYERALALMSCKFVDEVRIGVPYELTTQFIEDLKVHRVCHGKLRELPSDPYKVVAEMNILYQIDSGNDVTTRTIIERIIQSREMYTERNAKKPESQLSRVRLQGNKS